MLIPRYWARVSSHATTPDGRRIPFHAWRGSRESQEEAERLAAEAAGRIAGRIARGDGFPERYAYGERPLREEVVREIGDVPGEEGPGVAITRNSYGALVLNAARAFFIDVDDEPGRPQEESRPREDQSQGEGAGGSLLDTPLGRAVADALPASVRSLVEGFFGRSASATPPAPAVPQPTPQPGPSPGAPPLPGTERLLAWLARHPEWSVRVYRTAAGMRFLVTHAPFSPTGAEAVAAMEALRADPHYVRLCQVQKSFRARLTPKPWRLHMENPPVRFPYESAEDERVMREWEARYEEASRGYATCRFLQVLGSGAVHPEVGEVVRLHDEHTRATSGLPLA